MQTSRKLANAEFRLLFWLTRSVFLQFQCLFSSFSLENSFNRNSALHRIFSYCTRFFEKLKKDQKQFEQLKLKETKTVVVLHSQYMNTFPYIATAAEYFITATRRVEKKFENFREHLSAFFLFGQFGHKIPWRIFRPISGNFGRKFWILTFNGEEMNIFFSRDFIVPLARVCLNLPTVLF